MKFYQGWNYWPRNSFYFVLGLFSFGSIVIIFTMAYSILYVSNPRERIHIYMVFVFIFLFFIYISRVFYIETITRRGMVYTTKECDFRNFVTSIVKTLQNSNRKFRDEEIKKKKLAYTIHRRSIILKETYIKIVITKILNDPKTTIEIGPLSEDNKDEIMGLIDDIDNIDHKP